MKIQIENLRAQMRGVQLNSYQRALALDEYYKLLDYVEELEQSAIHNVSVSFEEGYAKGWNDATSEACKEIEKNYRPNEC